MRIKSMQIFFGWMLLLTILTASLVLADYLIYEETFDTSKDIIFSEDFNQYKASLMYIEDFESGTLSGWSVSGEGWEIINGAATNKKIGHNQKTCIYKVITISGGGGRIEFDWKVSSERNYDWLRFYVDNQENGKISGEVSWTRAEFYLPPGSHVIKWCYTKDGSVSRGQDRGYIDNIYIFEYPSLGAWKFEGNAGWFVINGYARSSRISHNQRACIYLDNLDLGDKGGIIQFSWKVSSERNYDWLRFYAGDREIYKISGEINWRHEVFYLPPNTNKVEWCYTKDGSVSRGEDAGFIDDVKIYKYSGLEGWQFEGSYWYAENGVAQNQKIGHNQRACIYRTITLESNGRLEFDWKVSSERNYDWLRFYLDGREMKKISGEVSWTHEKYPLTEGGHIIKWCYTKDGSVSKGEDRGYIDNVRVYQEKPPTVRVQNAQQNNQGNTTVTKAPINWEVIIILGILMALVGGRQK